MHQVFMTIYFQLCKMCEKVRFSKIRSQLLLETSILILRLIHPFQRNTAICQMIFVSPNTSMSLAECVVVDSGSATLIDHIFTSNQLSVICLCQAVGLCNHFNIIATMCGLQDFLYICVSMCPQEVSRDNVDSLILKM